MTLGVAAAPAVAIEEVAPMYYVIDGWEMVAVVDGGSVESLFLFRVDEAPAPENINAIWAQRGLAGAWWADAWPGSTRGEAVMWAVDNLGLMDPQTSIDAWPMDWAQDETFGVLAAPDPVPYGDGLALSHPLEPMISQAAEPLVLLQQLEELGEPAAASVVTGGGIEPAPNPEPGDECDAVQQVYWEAVANSIEAETLVAGTADTAFDDILNAAGCGGCTPRVWVTKPNCAGPLCGTWSILSGPFKVGCAARVHYIRDYSRTCSRLYTEIKKDCTFIRCTQTRTETGQKHVTDDFLLPNCSLTGFVPPASPSYNADCTCNVNCQWSDWTSCP